MSDTPVYDEVKEMFRECHAMWKKDGAEQRETEIVDAIKNLKIKGVGKETKDAIIKAITK